jgi:hypothetical protein
MCSGDGIWVEINAGSHRLLPIFHSIVLTHNNRSFWHTINGESKLPIPSTLHLQLRHSTGLAPSRNILLHPSNSLDPSHPVPHTSCILSRISAFQTFLLLLFILYVLLLLLVGVLCGGGVCIHSYSWV